MRGSVNTVCELINSANSSNIFSTPPCWPRTCGSKNGMNLQGGSKTWSIDTLVRGQEFMASQGQPTYGPPPLKAGFVSFEYAEKRCRNTL